MSVPIFVLSGLCVSACGGEPAPARPEPASPPAAVPSPSTAAPSTAAPVPESPPPVVATDSEAPAPPAAPPSTPSPSTSGRAKRAVKTFAVYTLSRGGGVPSAAREALKQVTELVESDQKRGVKVTFETKPYGLEGEKRLCAEYEDPNEGTRAWERAGAIVKGVELVNLVAEPCQKKEETP